MEAAFGQTNNIQVERKRGVRSEVTFLSPENLNEGSSKFITKDNRRRIASFKGNGKPADWSSSLWLLTPKHEGRRAELLKGLQEAFEESSMEMCERNPLNPSYVGSLLNLTPPESLYFSNLRGNGAHIPGLHQISYNRREVCTLPWTSNSCTSGPAAPPQSRAFGGYCPPFLSNSVSINTNSSSGQVKAHLEESARCFQVTNHKADESGRRDEVYAGEPGSASGRGYSDLDSRSHSSAAQLDPDSADPLNVNGTKQEQNRVHPSSSHSCSRTSFAEG
ncbi:hypothetical protein FQN60_001320 [Etheostoma spectabile]|uniref:Uncharacterized protein n=1 Tax=Etheostoma spectabile TaxID=54343 RepID=A0A5J5D652_9PERO|nr:hypothetical protein FQN60_001320 [Etheostoma spectabile]